MSRNPTHRLWWLGVACLALAPALATARSTDRDLPVKVVGKKATASNGPNQTSIVEGALRITQGTLVATGDHAVVYTDADAAVSRVVLTGSRAHIEQTSDDGTLSAADADTIDYVMDTSRAILTGHATTNRQGVGSSAAPRITYNVSDGTFYAEGSQSQMVNMTFLPRKRATGALPAKDAAMP